MYDEMLQFINFRLLVEEMFLWKVYICYIKYTLEEEEQGLTTYKWNTQHAVMDP